MYTQRVKEKVKLCKLKRRLVLNTTGLHGTKSILNYVIYQHLAFFLLSCLHTGTESTTGNAKRTQLVYVDRHMTLMIS